jgi:hypothetical protein
MCTFSTNHEELWAPIIEKAVSCDQFQHHRLPVCATTYAHIYFPVYEAYGRL